MARVRSIHISPSKPSKISLRRGDYPTASRPKRRIKNYLKAVNKGLLKIFSKMGVSTLQSYRGAQLFEAVGLNKALIDEYFTGTRRAFKASAWMFWRSDAIQNHALAFRRFRNRKPNWLSAATTFTVLAASAIY